MDNASQQPSKEWRGELPKAVLKGKTLTLTFSKSIEPDKAELFHRRACFRVACGDVRTWITTASVDGDKLILGISDYFAHSGGAVTVSYRRPEYGAIREICSGEYLQSFDKLEVENANAPQDKPDNQPGFFISGARSLKEAAGAVLASDFPGWGGHQSRIVRTDSGVYLTTLIASPPKTHKFGLYKVDGPEPSLIGEEIISGVAVTVLADHAGSIFVLCLDTQEGDINYGRPTVFKYPGGRGPATKIWYRGDRFSKIGDNAYSGYNYEGAGVDADGNILVALSYVDNSNLYISELVWLTLDTAAEVWSEVSSAPVKWSELYTYVLPKPGGGAGLVTNACNSFEQLGRPHPPGYDMPFLWAGVSLWDIPDAKACGISEVWRYQQDYTDEHQAPFTSQNNRYSGDAHIDSIGYTHIIYSLDGALGLETCPTQTRYLIFDAKLKKIRDRRLFDGARPCRFAETPSGELYILKATLDSPDFEVYAMNGEHTDLVCESPVFAYRVADSSGRACLPAHSGPCVTAPRGGSAREYYVDVALPRKDGGDEAFDYDAVATDWIVYRLHFPGK